MEAEVAGGGDKEGLQQVPVHQRIYVPKPQAYCVCQGVQVYNPPVQYVQYMFTLVCSPPYLILQIEINRLVVYLVGPKRLFSLGRSDTKLDIQPNCISYWKMIYPVFWISGQGRF